MRNSLWLHILEDLGPPEGCILPLWLRCVYLCIFPLQGLRILIGNADGFDFLRFVFTIHGVSFSGRMFLEFSRPSGQCFRFKIQDGILTLERVQLPSNSHQTHGPF